MTSTLTTDLRKLQNAADRARTVTHPKQREAARTFLISRATKLRHDRDALLTKIDAGWTFLDDHPDHPDYAAYDDQLYAWLTDFNAICDGLKDALKRWLDDDEEAA